MIHVDEMVARKKASQEVFYLQIMNIRLINNLVNQNLLKGAIHKRLTHAREREVCQKCRIVDKRVVPELEILTILPDLTLH